MLTGSNIGYGNRSGETVNHATGHSLNVKTRLRGILRPGEESGTAEPDIPQCERPMSTNLPP